MFPSPRCCRSILMLWCCSLHQTPTWLCNYKHREWFALCTTATTWCTQSCPMLHPVTQGRKGSLHFSLPSYYSHSSSFYLQADTGIWWKHVDIVLTQRINNNCFSPVNEMCSKLENLHWGNMDKSGEQKKTQTLGNTYIRWQKHHIRWLQSLAGTEMKAQHSVLSRCLQRAFGL